MLKSAGEAFCRDARQHLGISAPGLIEIGGEEAALHCPQARHRETFRAGQYLAGFGLSKAPARSRSGVEQNRNDGEIYAGPRGFRDARGGSNESRAVYSTDPKMPPTTVIWDGEIRIAASGDGEHTSDGLVEPSRIQSKMARLAALRGSENNTAAFAYGRCAQQCRGFFR